MVKFLIQVYKRIFPSYFIMSILCVIIIGSWYANLSTFNNTNNYNDDDSSMMSNVVNYLSHPYGKWLLYCKYIYIYIHIFILINMHF